MLKRKQVANTAYEYSDDGGSGKDDIRLVRRQRNHWRNTAFLFFTLVVVLLIHLQQEGHDKKVGHPKYRHGLDGANNSDEHNDHGEKHYEYHRGGSAKRPEHYRWSDARMLPPIPGKDEEDLVFATLKKALDKKEKVRKADMRIRYNGKVLDWDSETDDEVTGNHVGPAVDYTKLDYTYPDVVTKLPPLGEYPPMELLGEVLERFPQDDIDNPPQPFVENLLHFDYSDPVERAMAKKIRKMELPFKVYNVPEFDEAGIKWTDEYVSDQFDGKSHGIPRGHGHAQESEDNFFCFFRADNWNVNIMGQPYTMDVDFTFAKWAKHARYADKVSLPPTEKHYYWQAGVAKKERFSPKEKWSFISRDLPSFSSPDQTWFGWNPKKAQGIQCRFGERGVVAATHYDSGMNMVGMVTGAKRYILSPPKECPKLGIINMKEHPGFRHSLINYGHVDALKSNSDVSKEMPDRERKWMEITLGVKAVETILKAGEVLYIPSHWFHYVISLQKSAQCNVRSGRNDHGSKEFGGLRDVNRCVGENE